MEKVHGGNKRKLVESFNDDVELMEFVDSWNAESERDTADESVELKPHGYSPRPQADIEARHEQKDAAYLNTEPENDSKAEGSVFERVEKQPPTNTVEETKQVGKKRRVADILLSILIYGFCIALVAGSTMFAFSNDTGKSIFGYRFYHVITKSMLPSLDAGDMIFVRLCDPDAVEIGDIITFTPSSRNPNSYLTHRVRDIVRDENGKASKVVTRGDYNNTDDPAVDVSAIVGVCVLRIPKLGGAINFIRENIVSMSIALVCILLLLVVLRAYFADKKAPVPPYAHTRSSGYKSKNSGKTRRKQP